MEAAMVIMKFANGEYLHSVSIDPFHYTRTTERWDAQVYQHSSSALQDAALIKDETGADAMLEAAPPAYEIRMNDDDTVTINMSKDVLDRVAVSLAAIAGKLKANSNLGDQEYDDYVRMAEHFQYASTFLQGNMVVTPFGVTE